MTYFLRDDNNKSYFEVEAYNGKNGFDIKSHVYSTRYCKHVLSICNDVSKLNTWLNCLEILEEFRGWFWEYFIPIIHSDAPFDEKYARKGIEQKLEEIANILGLHIVTD